MEDATSIIDRYERDLEHEGIGVVLAEDLKQLVIRHRQAYQRQVFNLYIETLPYLVSVVNNVDRIDFSKIYYFLRRYPQRRAVIGEMTTGRLGVLGYTNTPYLDRELVLTQHRLTKKDIYFTCEKKLQMPKYLELRPDDDFAVGNFVTIELKKYQFTSDYEMIDRFAQSVAETEASLFSLRIQAKFSKVFRGDEDDISLDNLTSNLYNGSPFTLVNDMFTQDDVADISNNNVANFTLLADDKARQFSEINSFLGIPDNQIQKQSGVTQEESLGAQGFTNATENTVLETVNEKLRALNTHFGREMFAVFNDYAVSKVSFLTKDSDEGSHE